MSVIENIIETLKKNGLKQTDLAQHLEHLGITKQTITDWKSGKSNSYYSTIVEIANYLNVTTDYLLIGKDYIQSHQSASQSISDEAMKVASKYDELDFEGQNEVRNTIQSELKRIECTGEATAIGGLNNKRHYNP